MKNIFLIGDSVRFGTKGTNPTPGYAVLVKEKLEGIANVYAPAENSRFAQYTLREICNWVNAVDAESIDIIHWNNGLWDVLRQHGDEPLTPIDMYLSLLERIYKMLRHLFPNAKVIFALTTAVNDENTSPCCRYNRDIQRYNEAAKALMERLGVPVNDLYSISCTFDDSCYSDEVHPTRKGAERLADAVVEAVKKEAIL